MYHWWNREYGAIKGQCCAINITATNKWYFLFFFILCCTEEWTQGQLPYVWWDKSWNNVNLVNSALRVEHNILSIGAIVFTENEASNKLLTKFSFEKEGILKNYMHQNGIPYDTNIFSLIKVENHKMAGPR